jgi:predicted DCC family thiol-disulfide oxidoreductase YuxK
VTDARPLALTRIAIALVTLIALLGALGSGPTSAALVFSGVLAAMGLLVGWHPGPSALVAAAALHFVAPEHAPLRAMLVVLAFSDAGARASLDAVRSGGRARVAGLPAWFVGVVAVFASGWGLLHHSLSPVDAAAACAALLVLVPGSVFDAIARRAAGTLTTIEVLYDGKCSFCRGSVETLLALDTLERLRPRNLHDPEVRAAHPDLDVERAQREMIVYDGARTAGGFDAFRLLSWKLPAAWLVVPLLYLPPVPQIGRPVYRFIAARRMNLACELNQVPPRRPVLGDGRPRSRAATFASWALYVAVVLMLVETRGWP